jgi:vacuolar-type H+-ATPase subunit F/Vma7
MARIVYIGDAVTATGYRLAGAETRVPPEGEVAGTIREVVRGEVDLVLLSPVLAQSLPEEELAQVLTMQRPLVTLVPELFGDAHPPDLKREVRAALGIEA